MMNPRWVSLDDIAEQVMVKVGTHGSVDADGNVHREDILRDKPITEADMLTAQRALWAWVHNIPNPMKAMGRPMRVDAEYASHVGKLRAWKSPATPPLTIQGWIKKVWPYDVPMGEWIPDAPGYVERLRLSKQHDPWAA